MARHLLFAHPHAPQRGHEEVAERGLSPNTHKSYRDTIRLLFRFLAERHGTDPTRVTVEQVDATLLREFLRHLKDRRKSSAATRNQRLTALRSLFRFTGRLVPELVDHAAQIQAIPPCRAALPVVPYLEKAEIEALLAVPDRRRLQGRRDYALLLLLYNTGARASEAAGLQIADLSLAAVLAARFVGKGRKQRVCPLWTRTADTLRDLLGARLDNFHEAPVFLSKQGRPLTRHGVYALVKRTAQVAALTAPSLLAKRVSPHTLRHTTAVHLLRAGVDINTIRAWLGHVSLETTNRYAEVDLVRKAKALETCADNVPDLSPFEKITVVYAVGRSRQRERSGPVSSRNAFRIPGSGIRRLEKGYVKGLDDRTPLVNPVRDHPVLR